MKTRIEVGSGHVTIICSKLLAVEIGNCIATVHDGDDLYGSDGNYINVILPFLKRLHIALEQGNDFEEEEPIK